MRSGRSPRDQQTPFDRSVSDRLAVAATYVVLAFAVLGLVLVVGAAARSVFATGATEASGDSEATGPSARSIGESFAAAYLTHYAGESPEVSAARVAPYTSEAADPATVAMATDGNHTQRVINTAVVAVEPVANNRHRVVVDALVGRPTTDGEATTADGEATATDGEVAAYNANTSETFERYRLEVYVANGAGVVAPPLLAEAEPTTDATEAVGGELEDIMSGGSMEDLRKFLESYFAAAYGDPSSRSNLGQFYSSDAVASEIGLPPADLSYVELTGAGARPSEPGEAEGKVNRYTVEAYVGVKDDARGVATNQTYVLEVDKTDGRWAITGEGGGR